MFEYIRFAIRNPSYVTKNARRSWAVRKAMSLYRAKNPECAWCGRSKKLEVHHIEPVSVSPDKAGDESNFMMLCRKPACHQMIGHNGDWGGSYVENIVEICSTRDVVKIEAQQ